MKKRITLLLLSALLLTATSCGTSNVKPSPENTSEETSGLTGGVSEKITVADNMAQESESIETFPSYSAFKSYFYVPSYYGEQHSFYVDESELELQSTGVFLNEYMKKLYISEWQNSYALPIDINEDGYDDPEPETFSANKNTGILFFKAVDRLAKNPNGIKSILTMVKFDRNSDEVELNTVEFYSSAFITHSLSCFVDDQTCYWFGFSEVTLEYPIKKRANILDILLKSTDGGETWNFVNIDSCPMVQRQERFRFAKFVDENVGIVSGREHGGEAFYERTFVTIDGGKTWNNLSKLPDTSIPALQEVINFEKCDLGYILKLQVSGNAVQYFSEDMVTWSKLKE